MAQNKKRNLVDVEGAPIDTSNFVKPHSPGQWEHEDVAAIAERDKDRVSPLMKAKIERDRKMAIKVKRDAILLRLTRPAISVILFVLSFEGALTLLRGIA